MMYITFGFSILFALLCFGQAVKKELSTPEKRLFMIMCIAFFSVAIMLGRAI